MGRDKGQKTTGSAPRWAHALISGGSSGIGLAMARRLAAEGSRLTLLARDPAKLAAAAEALRAQTPSAQVAVLSADVQDPAAVARAVESAEADAPLDLIVASAGRVRAAPFAEIPLAEHRAMMETNYFGALHLIHAALPPLRARGRGTALIVGSAAGLAGFWGYGAYSPSKFALRGLAEALRAECARDGVSICVAHPPDTETPMLEAERLDRPPELTAIAGAAPPKSAETVARVLLQGAARGRFDIPVGLSTWALLRLAPAARPLVDRAFDQIAARAGRAGRKGR